MKLEHSLTLYTKYENLLKKRDRTQINKIRNKRREITIDTTDIQKKKKMLLTVICQKIWQPRRNGQVSKHNLSKLIQEEKDNLKRLITRRETESVISKTASNKSPGLEGFTGEFYQIYKELIAILLKLFQKTEEETKLPKLFYDTTVTLVPKPETLQKKKITGQ